MILCFHAFKLERPILSSCLHTRKLIEICWKRTILSQCCPFVFINRENLQLMKIHSFAFIYGKGILLMNAHSLSNFFSSKWKSDRRFHMHLNCFPSKWIPTEWTFHEMLNRFSRRKRIENQRNTSKICYLFLNEPVKFKAYTYSTNRMKLAGSNWQ